MSTTLQVYTAKFILEASVSKRNPKEDKILWIVLCPARSLPCSSSAVNNLVYMVPFLQYFFNYN